MKKSKILLSVLLIILISCVSAVAVSAAGTNYDPAEGMLWKITHSDGTVDYAEGFNEPFVEGAYRQGDVFEFLEDKYYLYHENFITIKTSVDITVDLTGVSIICPETKADVSDINAQVFNLSLSNAATVTFLMDGAEMYVPTHARSAFGVNGNGYIVIDGGEVGGKVFAPGAVNLMTDPSDQNKQSHFKNMYFYKNSVNMAALISVRNTAVLKLTDCYAVSENGSWPVFNLIKNGKIILNNTVAFNTAGSGLFKCDNTGTPTVEINDGSYFYGASSFASNVNLKLSPESFYSDDISAYVGEDDVLKIEYIKQLFKVYSFTAAGEYVEKVADLTFNYVLADNMVTTPNRKYDSVWQLEKSDGTVVYTANIYTPFRYAKEYKSFTLLRNVTLDKGWAAALSADFTLNLGTYKVLASEGSDIRCMLSVSGTGNLTLQFDKSTVVIETATLVKADGQQNITVNSAEAFIKTDTLIDAGVANVTVKGGFYEAVGGDGIATAGSVIIEGATVKGVGHGKLIDAKGKVSLFAGTNILASLGAGAVFSEDELRVAKDLYIHGRVKAASVVAEGDATFSCAPEAKMDKLLLGDTYRKAFDILTYTSKGVETKRVTYTFTHQLTELNRNLYASFTFYSDASLNIYLPQSVVDANSEFALRIVVDGLLYEAKAEDCQRVVKGGKNLAKFTYGYIYPTSYSSVVTLTVISGSFNSQSEVRISELLDRTLDKTENELDKSVVASYIAYSAKASGVTLAADGEVEQLRMKFSASGASADLMKYMASVSFSSSNREVTFGFKSELGGAFSVSYLFGNEQLKYDASATDGSMSIPVYRLAPNAEVEITYTSDGQEDKFTVNMFDIINSIDEKSTSYEIARLYGAYLQSICM